jgi:hypothetical protein
MQHFHSVFCLYQDRNSPNELKHITEEIRFTVGIQDAASEWAEFLPPVLAIQVVEVAQETSFLADGLVIFLDLSSLML